MPSTAGIEAPSGPPLIPVEAEQGRRLAELVTMFGFAPLAGFLRPDWLGAMQAEAEVHLAGAVRAEQQEGLSYSAAMAGLGPVARAFLAHPEMLSLLGGHFGGAHALTEDMSCFTRYDAADHLGPHLDEPAAKCAITVIVYLDAVSPDPGSAESGLVLKVYGEDAASVGRTRLRIPTRAGTVVLGRGARVWHERPPLAPGERVTAITACYGSAGRA